MPTFKLKNSKKVLESKTNTATLDSTHKAVTAKFRQLAEETLPQLRAKQVALQAQLQAQVQAQVQGQLPAQVPAQSVNINTLPARQKLADQLAANKKQIKEIQASEIDYLLNNSHYIFEYFEAKKNIINTTATDQTALAGFFRQPSSEPQPQSSSATADRTITTVQKYLANVDPQRLNLNHYVVSTTACSVCFLGELVPIEHEGILVCNQCSTSSNYLIEIEKFSYKEPPKEAGFYAYKRINHFREILAQFQAKETTQIPPDVFENINQQIKKERINLSQFSDKRAKEVLKKLGYNKYYEHIPFIKDKLGIRPPIMTAELECTLCNLFMDIQAPYAKVCPDDRVNFLNYYYTVYKLCELLDQVQFLPYFPMLKDREKRIEQDEIWRNICAELDWEFIPTI